MNAGRRLFPLSADRLLLALLSFEGALLLAVYRVLGIAFFFLP